MKKLTLLTIVLFLSVLNAGCWTTPDQGKVQVQTIWSEVKQVIRAPGIWTITTWGDDYYDLDIRSTPISDIAVRASSKEPANFTIKAQLVYSVPDNDDVIKGFVKKFGLDEEDRKNRLLPQLSALFQTEYRNAASNYDAYTLVAEQEKIQKQVYETLKPVLKEQFFLNLEAIQFLGKPDFDNDDIDNAASKVVANQKLKEAAEAALAAKRVEVQTKELESQTFANPQMLKIKELELQKEIAEAWSKHQGTLVFGSNSPLQLINK